MSERYARLFALPLDMHGCGSPVIIAAGHLLKDNVTGGVLAQLKLKNIDSKVIKAVKVKVSPLDTVNKPLGEAVTYDYLDLAAARDTEFGQKIAVPLPNPSTRAFNAEVTEVAFSDNSVWTSAGGQWWPLRVPEAVGDAELIKQYRQHFGEKAQYKPFVQGGLWSCACGAINAENEDTCHVCGNRLSELLSCDLTELAAERNRRLAKEQAEREAKAAADKAAAEAKAAATKAAAEARAKKAKKLLAILLPIAAVCIAAVILTIKVFVPNSNYNRALALKDSGDYEAAITAFEAMDGYKDSAEQFQDCTYFNALVLKNAGDYEAALTAFESISGYKDSAEQIKKMYKEKIANADKGDTVYFGSYEQDNNAANGKEDIAWLVLERAADSILVISWSALDCQPYNTEYTDVTWETCSLREWLNDAFLNAAFNEAEQTMIPNVTVSADKNPKYSTNLGNSTTDQVFLLSIAEMDRHIRINDHIKMSKCPATAFAKAQGARTIGAMSGFGSYCWWWLRTPGNDSHYATDVDGSGSIDNHGEVINKVSVAVRPAMWIDLGA